MTNLVHNASDPEITPVQRSLAKRMIERGRASHEQIIEWLQQWKKYEELCSLFHDVEIVRPNCPYEADEIRREIERRQNAGEW